MNLSICELSNNSGKLNTNSASNHIQLLSAFSIPVWFEAGTGGRSLRGYPHVILRIQGQVVYLEVIPGNFERKTGKWEGENKTAINEFIKQVTTKVKCGLIPLVKPWSPWRTLTSVILPTEWERRNIYPIVVGSVLLLVVRNPLALLSWFSTE